MKNLSIEEKSKRYDEALDEAKTIHKAIKQELKPVIEQIFPEVKESEDEQMWKLIKKYAHYNISELALEADHITREYLESWLEKQGQGEQKIAWSAEDEYLLDETTRHLEELIRIDKAKHCGVDVQFYQRDIDWLKSLKERVQQKQGKQKSVDKVEPKFKAGQWYQCTKDFFGKGVTFDKNTAYYCTKEGCLQDEYGCHIAIVKDLYDNFKLWTLNEAKDGDVLCARGSYYKEYLFMFSSFTEDNVISTHFGYDVFHKTFDTKLTRLGRKEDFMSVTPATKAQRELLFEKMHRAGYKWDTDKKKTIKL